MLTPSFEIKQDDIFLTIYIKAPHARVTDTEIFIEENEFRFHSKPYFLRLTLPGNIIEDGREEAKYDSDKGTFTIKVPKETGGQVFEGLDMITKLLTPKGKFCVQSPMIEVLSESSSEPNAEEEEEEEEFDWHIEQIPFTEEKLSTDGPKYGFAIQKSGLFSRLQDEVVEIVDLKDPDHCTVSDRKTLRQAAEQDKFDEDHYLADLYDDSAIQEVMPYNPLSGCDICESFSEKDKEVLRNLPKREYLLDNKILVYLGLVDIIFAYCYDMRTTEGEHNVESPWTICKLSSTLSWLDCFSSVEEVLTASYRRCLCYPLYRHWLLTTKVHEDVSYVFTLGREGLLRCLLDIHKCFSERYPHYLLNDLYITDYCVWIQSADPKQIQSLADAVKKCIVKKEDVGFNLQSIESLCEGSLNEDDIDTVAKAVSDINIGNHDSDDYSTENDTECSDTDTFDESSDSLTSNTDNQDGTSKQKSSSENKTNDQSDVIKDSSTKENSELHHV